MNCFDIYIIGRYHSLKTHLNILSMSKSSGGNIGCRDKSFSNNV